MVTTKNRKQKRGMKFMIKATLVLEGGANRGVFTSGVLDYLMGKELYMSNVIGVSAGACNAVDYVSKQAGRSRECVIHREKEYDYVYGLKKTLKEKALMDMDMLFDKFPNEIYPFDFDFVTIGYAAVAQSFAQRFISFEQLGVFPDNGHSHFTFRMGNDIDDFFPFA